MRTTEKGCPPQWIFSYVWRVYERFLAITINYRLCPPAMDNIYIKQYYNLSCPRSANQITRDCVNFSLCCDQFRAFGLAVGCVGSAWLGLRRVKHATTITKPTLGSALLLFCSNGNTNPMIHCAIPTVPIQDTTTKKHPATTTMGRRKKTNAQKKNSRVCQYGKNIPIPFECVLCASVWCSAGVLLVLHSKRDPTNQTHKVRLFVCAFAIPTAYHKHLCGCAVLLLLLMLQLAHMREKHVECMFVCVVEWIAMRWSEV